jgi:uncharacterized membrane protein
LKVALASGGFYGIWILVILFGIFGVAYLALFALVPGLFGPEGDMMRTQLKKLSRQRDSTDE